MAKYASETYGILIAFWDGKSRGTKNMIDTAKKHGLKSILFKFKLSPLGSFFIVTNIFHLFVYSKTKGEKIMKNLGVKVTNYMDQAINKLETVLEQVDKGIGRTVSALDLVEQDISTTVKKDLRTFRKGIKLFARLLNVVFTATFLLVLYLKFTQPDIYADLVRVMPAVLDTYVSQLPPWAGDAMDSLLDIVKKVLF